LESPQLHSQNAQASGDQSGSAPSDYSNTINNNNPNPNPPHRDALSGTQSTNLPRSSISSGQQQPGSEQMAPPDSMQEDDDVDDDDVAMGEQEGEGNPTQSAADRRAERRKMKRFR
jgi:hypothetical protein